MGFMGMGEGQKPAYVPVLLGSSSLIFGLCTIPSYVYSPKSDPRLRRLRNAMGHSARGTLLHAIVLSGEHSLAAVRGHSEVERLDSFCAGAVIGSFAYEYHGPRCFQPLAALVSAVFLGSLYAFISPSHHRSPTNNDA